MSERVPAWAESDERYPEREAEWRAAIARAERAEAQLAALREAAADVRVAFYDLSVPHRVAVERHAVLDAALADTAAAAEAYRERIEAPLRAEIERLTTERIGERVAAAEAEHESLRALAAAEAERDTLAAALAEVRETLSGRVGDLAARLVAPGPKAAHVSASECHEISDAIEAARAALAALPADIAADAFRRMRAEALRDAASCLRDHVEAMTPGDLRSGVDLAADMVAARARAADERGGR